MLGKSDLIESDVIQGGHPIPRTTLNKPFPAVKITVLTKAIYRFDAILIKILTISFAEMDMLILESIWKCKGPRIVKTLLKMGNRVGDSYFLISKFTTNL